MSLPAIDPIEEAARLRALHELAVLDTPPEPVFDAITRAAADLCGTPIALISLIDTDRQWFKSNLGLPGMAQTARDLAFCGHAIQGEALLEVRDAQADARFADNPLVTGDPAIRFYAGVPIVVAGGERIGTVCAIDRRPRALSEAQRQGLANLSRIAAACLADRRQALAVGADLAASEARYRAIVDDQSEMISLATRDGTLTFVNQAYARQFGLAAEQLIGRNLIEFVDTADRAAVLAHLERVCSSGLTTTGINRMESAQGGVRWVAWTNRALADAQGRVTTIHSVGRDVTEQHDAEQALLLSEQRYRSLYEVTPAMLHSIDLEGRLVHVSDRWLQVMGYERDEVLGRRSTDFFDAESRRRALDRVLPEYFRHGQVERVNYRLVRKDGSTLDVLLSAVLERDAQGRFWRSLSVLEDVTERKRLATELARTHADLNAIVDNVPAMLGYWDHQRVNRFANRDYQAAVGLPLERIVGQPIQGVYEHIDPAGYEQAAPHIAGVLAGQRQEFEHAMLTTQGLRQFHVTYVPDRQADGEVAGFYGMAYDITGRKALELRLGESELRYRSLFDHLNSGFALHEIVLDADGTPVDYRFLAMNAAFTAMTGLQPAAAIGRCVTELLPGIVDDPADWIGTFGRVALAGVAVHFEQRAQPLDQWFEVVAYRPAAGQFAVIATDISGRKQTEASRARGEQQLQAALQEKEMLLKEVYHRVKNNLQVVQSLLSLQRRSVPEGPARQAIEESVQRVRAMALVHEKLYQSGNLAAVNLAEYTADLLLQIGEANGAQARGIRLRAQIEDVETGLDHAIPYGLLVTELVTNSLKHAFTGRDAGEVCVSLGGPAGAVRLAVSDDGGGVAPGFDLAASTSMGLELSASLARQLGGELQVESGDGGSVFSALLSRV